MSPQAAAARVSLMSRTSSTVGEMTPLKAMAHHFKLSPEDSVYSYFMLVPPVEHRRNHSFCTPLIMLAFVLVAVNFVMQYGLLLVVGDYIMDKHVEWVSSITHLQHAWYHVFPLRYNLPPPRCRGEDSALCANHGDGISCAPSVIHVLTDWSLLDSNGDGVWSRFEAQDEKLREAVQCDYDVDLLSLFDMTASQLNSSDVLKGRRDATLFSGDGIHKAYFNWYLHKPLLCQYGDPDVCGLLFERGFFDEALRQQPFKEVKSTASALKYCTRILQQECFEMLPTTYSVWRSVSLNQCGEKVFGKSTFHSPAEHGEAGGVRHMMTVNFRTYMVYATTKGLAFRLFLCILLVTFFAVMALEMRSMIKVLVWAIKFPKDENAGKDGRIVSKEAVVIMSPDKRYDEDDEEVGAEKSMRSSKTTADFGTTSSASENSMSLKEICAVRTDHRCAVVILTLLRLCLWFFLVWSGVLFLTGKPRYLTLIFDALSLVFIFEIDELLYNTMIRHELQEDHRCIAPLQVPTLHGGSADFKTLVILDTVQFILILVFATAVVATYCNVELNPLIDAIGCLCMADGPRCHAAQFYSKSWWDNYWSTTLPAANLIIDQLRSE